MWSFVRGNIDIVGLYVLSSTLSSLNANINIKINININININIYIYIYINIIEPREFSE